MNIHEWILIEDICTYYRVERGFVEALHESELIHLRVFEKKPYLSIDEVREFEKMRRLHYEMNINLEGLEAVKGLLDSIGDLQKENIKLRNRLRLYE